MARGPSPANHRPRRKKHNAETVPFYEAPASRSAHFSPIATHVACVLPEMTNGMIDASATLSPSKP